MGVYKVIEMYEKWFADNDVGYILGMTEGVPHMKYTISSLGTGIIKDCDCNMFIEEKNGSIEVTQIIHLKIAPHKEHVWETMKYINEVNLRLSRNTHLAIDISSHRVIGISKQLFSSVELFTEELIEDTLKGPIELITGDVGDELIAVAQGFHSADEGVRILGSQAFVASHLI